MFFFFALVSIVMHIWETKRIEMEKVCTIEIYISLSTMMFVLIIYPCEVIWKFQKKMDFKIINPKA